MIRYSFTSKELHITVVAKDEDEAWAKLRDRNIESIQIKPNYDVSAFKMDKHYEVAEKTRMEAWLNPYPDNNDYSIINWRDSYGRYYTITVRNDELTLRGVIHIFSNMGYRINTLYDKWNYLLKG